MTRKIYIALRKLYIPTYILGGCKNPSALGNDQILRIQNTWPCLPVEAERITVSPAVDNLLPINGVSQSCVCKSRTGEPIAGQIHCLWSCIEGILCAPQNNVPYWMRNQDKWTGMDLAQQRVTRVFRKSIIFHIRVTCNEGKWSMKMQITWRTKQIHFSTKINLYA